MCGPVLIASANVVNSLATCDPSLSLKNLTESDGKSLRSTNTISMRCAISNVISTGEFTCPLASVLVYEGPDKQTFCSRWAYSAKMIAEKPGESSTKLAAVDASFAVDLSAASWSTVLVPFSPSSSSCCWFASRASPVGVLLP